MIICKSDMSGVYLSINLATTPYLNKYSNDAIKQLKKDTKLLRDEIKTQINDTYLENIDHADYFNDSCIIAKEYTKEELMSQDCNIDKDLNEFLDIYQDLISSYNPIPVVTWKALLQDKSIINKKMIDVLDILYELGGSATFGEIADIRNRKNFGLNDKSYNTLNTSTGKKIKSKLQKLPIHNRDGKEIFYTWLCNVSSKGNLALFILKNNLKISIKELKEDGIWDNLKPETITKNDTMNENEEDFFDYLNNKGFYFDKETIENFLLSLKVKPFLILTGNSGTGKTQLAKQFAQYISTKYDNLDLSKFEEIPIKTNVKVMNPEKFSVWTLQKDTAHKIFNPNEYPDRIPVVVDGVEGIGRVNSLGRLFVYDDNIKNHLKELFDEDPYQRVDVEIKLTEKKGNEKIYEIIPVGSNWTDNKNILGYYNVITEEYQSTKAYELIKESQKHPKIPFFLILDEMNLSRVERYFADFLSALESDEKIPLTGAEAITIPKNLMIIGTVNVDETTYMFSPKVLDRANTIEFKTQPAYEYMQDELNILSPEGDLDFLYEPLNDDNVKNLKIDELREYFTNTKIDNEYLWDILSKELDSLQNILRDSGFDYGFRVINEITKFMAVAFKYERYDFNNEKFNRYFDAQILQKVLPKLHGSEKTLNETLENLLEFCKDGETIKYKKSNDKLNEMKKTLNNQKFVSFIN